MHESQTGNPGSTRYYYVDEAGDGTLFNRKGHVIVGSEGCSRYFILGLVDIPDPGGIGSKLKGLREQLLADPYFKGVPSMQPEAAKTAVAFHAKDDLPEVRREVFSLLRKHEFRFFAVVHDKMAVLEYVRQRGERDPDYRYNQNELYDYLVRRLFRNLLHKDDAYMVYFAKRGKSDRTAALRTALEAARHRFADQYGIESGAVIDVIPTTLARCRGLEVVDYFSWALQRLYEKREDRYLEILWPSFRMVHDIDDTRERQYGVYYTQRNPLTLSAIKEQQGI
jgi:hypothetical protein